MRRPTRVVTIKHSSFWRCPPHGSQRGFSLGSKPDDGVPLTPGSALHSVHGWCRRHLNQGVVFHCTKFLTLASCFSSDWLFVRCVLISSSLSSGLFHFLFADPRPVRMLYGLVFAVGHTLALAYYLLETSDYWTLPTPQDEEVYEAHFKPHGFSKYQFKQMLKHAEYITYSSQTTFIKHGDAMEYIYLLLDGEAHFHKPTTEGDRKNFPTLVQFEEAIARGVEVKGTVVRQGLWVGEIYDKHYDWDVPHAWFMSCTTQADARLLRFAKRPVHDLFSSTPSFQSAALAMQVNDLWKTRKATSVATSIERAGLFQRIEALEGRVAELSKPRPAWWKAAFV